MSSNRTVPPARAFPGLYIAGVPKAGTTSLWRYLRAHPDVFFPTLKEPYFFAPDIDVQWRIATKEAYLNLYSDCGGASICGDASPGYLYSETAARNIAGARPDARVVVVLRNPVDMLYSWHGQLLKTSHEDILDFKTALGLQEVRKAGQRVPATCEEPRLLYYYDLARYSEQLERLFKWLPRNQVEVFTFEDLESDPMGVYCRILSFIGVDESFQPPMPRYNAAQPQTNLRVRDFMRRHPRLRTFLYDVVPEQGISWGRALGTLFQRQRPAKLSGSLRRELLNDFKSEIRRTSMLIDRDLSHWIEG